MAGRCTRWITDAAENVFPLPVTPSSVWCASPSVEPLDELLDCLGLIARGA